MKTLNEAQTEAIASLSPRQRYAAEVIRGQRRWSGMDLKGKAKQYGSSYERQRNLAQAAFMRAGGLILPVDDGLHVSAVAANPEFTRFETTLGLAEMTPGSVRAKLITGE